MNAILVIVGPSGVGKTTVANRVVERCLFKLLNKREMAVWALYL